MGYTIYLHSDVVLTLLKQNRHILRCYFIGPIITESLYTRLPWRPFTTRILSPILCNIYVIADAHTSPFQVIPYPSQAPSPTLYCLGYLSLILTSLFTFSFSTTLLQALVKKLCKIWGYVMWVSRTYLQAFISFPGKPMDPVKVLLATNRLSTCKDIITQNCTTAIQETRHHMYHETDISEGIQTIGALAFLLQTQDNILVTEAFQLGHARGFSCLCRLIGIIGWSDQFNCNFSWNTARSCVCKLAKLGGGYLSRDPRSLSKICDQISIRWRNKLPAFKVRTGNNPRMCCQSQE